MVSLGHGGNVKEISRQKGINEENIIDFSANINPLGVSDNVKKAIIDNLSQIEKYPDITYFELKNSIIDYENEIIKDKNYIISKDNLILGNGAAEVLFSLVKGINPKNTLLLAPTFSEYEEAVKSVNGDISLYYIKEENDFNIKEDILNYINEKLDLIFICNPNNPTGQLTNKNLLERILEKAKKFDVIVAIDESFLDFVRNDFSMINYTKKYENLFIVKSLTKFFAIPGIRIGYGICNNNILIEKINKNIPAWNINSIAEVSTKSALKDKKYINATIEYVEKEQSYLYNKLKELRDIKIYKPSVNFILIKSINNIDLKSELLKNNILIRSCGNYHGLDENYYRVAVRTHKENKMLLRCLHEILN